MVGKFLYYGQSVEPMLLVALGSIAAEQAKVTAQTEDAVHQLLDYCETHPNVKLCYHSSNMILIIHIDASYLSELKACIISGSPFFMGSQNFQNTRKTNGAVHTVSNIMKNVMGSATEA